MRAKERMKKTALLGLIIILSVMMFSGCNTPTVKKLVWETYPPKQSDADVELFVGSMERPIKSIAIIQSRYFDEQTAENKSKMLADMRKMGRRIGADAVADIRILPKRFQGMVVDERTPFPDWKPGNTYAFFMRGTAVVYQDDNSTSPTE